LDKGWDQAAEKWARYESLSVGKNGSSMG